MIKRFIVTMFALLPLTLFAAEAGGLIGLLTKNASKTIPQKNETIKVLILHDKPGAILEVKGKYKLFDPHAKEYITTRHTGKRKYIQTVKEGLKWGEEFPGIYQLLVVPDSPSTTMIVDGIEYQGNIYVYDIGGAISIVNECDYDDFLKGFMSSMLRHTKLPQEALAAAIIAARTNLFYMSQHPRSPYWAIDGRKISYQGHALVHPSDELQRALEETHHMVMSQNNTFTGPIEAFPVQWESLIPSLESQKPVSAHITLGEASQMANQGIHASQILKKAFPGVAIRLLRTGNTALLH